MLLMDGGMLAAETFADSLHLIHPSVLWIVEAELEKRLEPVMGSDIDSCRHHRSPMPRKATCKDRPSGERCCGASLASRQRIGPVRLTTRTHWRDIRHRGDHPEGARRSAVAEATNLPPPEVNRTPFRVLCYVGLRPSGRECLMARLRLAAKRRAPYVVFRLEDNSGVILQEDGSLLLTEDNSTLKLSALDANGTHVYPAFQLSNGCLLQGVEEVVEAFSVEDGWMQVNFMLTGDARLGHRRPLDVLCEGHIDDVIKAARTYGEHGAA
jgi:hypothetical protein